MRRVELAVVGAGIVGVSVALALRRQGHEVLLLDRSGVAAEASQGNAGGFAFHEIEPLASPGIIWRAPRWLLDPLGPLALRPSYTLALLPWLLRFARNSSAQRYHAALRAQSELMHLASAALARQVEQVQGQRFMGKLGQLRLYASEQAFQRDKPNLDERTRLGWEQHELTSAAAIAEIQPGIHPSFSYASYAPSWRTVSDPQAWTQHLAEYFQRAGGVFQLANVQSLQANDADVRLHCADGQHWQANQVVICCGAWSYQLARALGERIPLESERGYNTSLPTDAFDLRCFLTFAEHGFVVSPTGGGVRVGGAVELGGLQLPPNYRRADNMLRLASRFLPGLSTSNGRQWMGHRPSLPDSLPIIGKSATSDRVVYAFGHGHLGLTQSAATAELVTELINNTQPTSINLHPLRADRF